MKTVLEQVIQQHRRRLVSNIHAVPTCAVFLAEQALTAPDSTRYISKIAMRGNHPWKHIALEFRAAAGIGIPMGGGK